MSRKTSDLYEDLPTEQKEYIQFICGQFPTNPELSTEILADKISIKTELKLNRKSAVRILDYLNIPKRTKAMVDLSRTTISQQTTNLMAEAEFKKILQNVSEQFTKEQLEESYSLNSMEYLANILDISTYYVEKVLDYYDIEIRDTITYMEVYELYKSRGKTLEDLKKFYLNKRNTTNDFIDHIENVTDVRMSHTSLYRLLNKLDISKPIENIAHAQGRKSRSVLLENLDFLKLAGFDSREELAQYYHDNPRLTYQRLLDELHSQIGETVFTNRWLERNMAPHLPKDRLTGVSRGELGLRYHVEGFYEGEIVYNDRSIVAPKELDIVLPEKKLAIEFNGDYWHSDKFFRQNQGVSSFEYHARKQNEARLKGYTLVFVWESDWNDNADFIEQAVSKFIASNGSVIYPELLCLSKDD